MFGEKTPILIIGREGGIPKTLGAKNLGFVLRRTKIGENARARIKGQAKNSLVRGLLEMARIRPCADLSKLSHEARHEWG